jgi:hypothetical protein
MDGSLVSTGLRLLVQDSGLAKREQADISSQHSKNDKLQSNGAVSTSEKLFSVYLVDHTSR